jgi:hypothetical protein
MPRRRWTLSIAERRDYKLIAEALNAAGADLNLSVFAAGEALRVTPVSVMAENYLRFSTRGFVCIFQVSIVALTPLVILQDFKLSSPEWELNTYFLEDPSVRSSRERCYRLIDGTNFDRTEVLNHRVGDAGRLRYGNQIQGLLLAQSFDRLPDCYKSGSVVPVVLSITDQFGDVSQSTIRLQVEQFEMREGPRNVRRSSLFGPGEAPISAPKTDDKIPVAESTGDASKIKPGVTTPNWKLRWVENN